MTHMRCCTPGLRLGPMEQFWVSCPQALSPPGASPSEPTFVSFVSFVCVLSFCASCPVSVLCANVWSRKDQVPWTHSLRPHSTC
jgi:hypothetical protein